MGWTYQELQETPAEFLEYLYARWNTESEYQSQVQKEQERKMKAKLHARKR